MDSINKSQTINLDDMSKSDSVYIIWQLLNKAQSKGVFTIDEACAAKAAVKIISEEIPKESATNKTN